MANNNVDQNEFIPKKEIRQLPDRSDLSELYYDTKKGYQKGSINYETNDAESPTAQYKKFINRNFIKIGLLVPLPISIAIFLYSVLANSDLVKQNAMIGLIVILVLAAVLIAVVSISYRSTKNVLEKLGIGASYYYIQLILCMGFIYTPAFLVGSLLDNMFLTHVAAYFFVSIFCIMATKILLVALGDESVGPRISTILRGIPLAICLSVAVVFSIYLF